MEEEDFDNGIPGFEFDENDWPTTNERPPPFVDRYFSRFYKTDMNGKIGEDHCVLCHSNKICIVTLAKSHPVITEKKVISSINFQVADGINRLDNKVSGKGKRGAQWVKPNSALCRIICEDGSQYTVCACVRGMLVEINETILTSPNFIAEKPEDAGFVAIILIKRNEYEREKKALLSEEKYKEIVNNRSSTVDKSNNAEESNKKEEALQL